MIVTTVSRYKDCGKYALTLLQWILQSRLALHTFEYMCDSKC